MAGLPSDNEIARLVRDTRDRKAHRNLDCRSEGRQFGRLIRGSADLEAVASTGLRTAVRFVNNPLRVHRLLMRVNISLSGFPSLKIMS